MLRPVHRCKLVSAGDVCRAHAQYHLTTLPLLTKDEVAAQVQRAHDAQPRWAATSFAQRQMLMRSLKAWVLRDMEVILDVACRDTGKTREALLCVAWVRH